MRSVDVSKETRTQVVKLFLDANVLFIAAPNPNGKAAFVLELSQKGRWSVVSSSFAMEEARRNLEAKFPDALVSFDKLLRTVGVVPDIAEKTCPIELPEGDAPIFLSALGARCSHLLTGDRKDFGRFMNEPKRTSGVVIQTVADFLSKL
ncbi:MAG TPA: PIN domain-containing protein [Vicinamibacteria bacterium]|nr:PIN domain-containing protein [Vicinamibacteria bacterium]